MNVTSGLFAVSDYLFLAGSTESGAVPLCILRLKGSLDVQLESPDRGRDWRRHLRETKMISDITPQVFHVGKKKEEHKNVADQTGMFEVNKINALVGRV